MAWARGAGGWGVVTADAVTAHPDLTLAALPDDLRTAIDGMLPPRWSRNNPIDLAGGETRDTIPELLDLTAEPDPAFTVYREVTPSVTDVSSVPSSVWLQNVPAAAQIYGPPAAPARPHLASPAPPTVGNALRIALPRAVTDPFRPELDRTELGEGRNDRRTGRSHRLANRLPATGPHRRTRNLVNRRRRPRSRTHRTVTAR